jgi:ABC-type lipoprotein release transport system permease subunit
MFTGLQPSDLFTGVIGLVALALATFLASFIPARRAASLDPIDALRSD